MAIQGKQGENYYGGCSCDYRRAVIILCIVNLVFSIIAMANPSLSKSDPDDYEALMEISDKYAKPAKRYPLYHDHSRVGAVIPNFWMAALYAARSIQLDLGHCYGIKHRR
eukprot:scaffold4963_cov87-Cylindrotheca_fusiformis.AAC.4